MAAHAARLADQVAIVAGSGRGIGAEIALRLAREGAHVIANGVSAQARARFGRMARDWRSSSPGAASASTPSRRVSSIRR